MRGPADKHSEIVAEIIKCVKCPPEVTPFIERIARRLIRDLRNAPEPFSGNQKENIEFAEKLRNDITRLEHTLKGAPKNPFALSVLFEERFWGVWWDTQATLFEINANAKRYIAQERSHQSRFAEELSRVRAQCDKIISLGPGEHGRTKHQHAAAAKASLAVVLGTERVVDGALLATALVINRDGTIVGQMTFVIPHPGAPATTWTKAVVWSVISP